MAVEKSFKKIDHYACEDKKKIILSGYRKFNELSYVINVKLSIIL